MQVRPHVKTIWYQYLCVEYEYFICSDVRMLGNKRQRRTTVEAGIQEPKTFTCLELARHARHMPTLHAPPKIVTPPGAES